MIFGKHKPYKTSYGIIGLGRFGSALTAELAMADADILVLDRDEDKVREARELTENALVVGNLDKKTLMDTGIQNCDVVVVCIGSQMEVSILTTLNLVSLGVPTVIAKANSPEHGEILEKLGAKVVYPERDMAVRLANRLENSRVLDSIQLSEEINISKMVVPDRLAGKSIVEANLRSRFGLNIIAIESGQTVTDNIRPDYVFQKNDTIILCGSRDGLFRLNEWNEENHR